MISTSKFSSIPELRTEAVFLNGIANNMIPEIIDEILLPVKPNKKRDIYLEWVSRHGGSMVGKGINRKRIDNDLYTSLNEEIGGAMTWSDMGKYAYNTLTYNPVRDLEKRALEVAKVAFSGRKNLIPSAQATVDKYGNIPITEMIISRHPIQRVINTVNLLTAGELTRKLEEMPYDTMFHLQLLVRVGDVWVSLEKKSTVKASVKNPNIKNGQFLQVKVNPPYVTINSLLENSLKNMGINKFYHYSAYDNNCQNFVLSLLASSGLETEENKKFVKQDTEQLFTTYYRKIANTVTDIGHYAETALEGGRKIKPKDYLNYSAFGSGRNIIQPKDYLNYSSF
jgi:hypothetical protein